MRIFFPLIDLSPDDARFPWSKNEKSFCCGGEEKPIEGIERLTSPAEREGERKRDFKVKKLTS
jgi:hypothetical protein